MFLFKRVNLFVAFLSASISIANAEDYKNDLCEATAIALNWSIEASEQYQQDGFLHTPYLLGDSFFIDGKNKTSRPVKFPRKEWKKFDKLFPEFLPSTCDVLKNDSPFVFHKIGEKADPKYQESSVFIIIGARRSQDGNKIIVVVMVSKFGFGSTIGAVLVSKTSDSYDATVLQGSFYGSGKEQHIFQTPYSRKK